MGLPPGMDPAVASQVIDYLKANPQAARQSLDTAHRLMRTPGMAQQMLDAQARPQPPHTRLLRSRAQGVAPGPASS